MSQDNIGNLGFNVSTRGLVTGQRAMNSFTATGREMEQGITENTDTINSGFSSIASKASLITGALAAIGATSYFKTMIEETKKSEENLFKIDALLTATGKASEISGEKMRASAESFALATLDSVEGVQSAQAIMLTFRNIGVESFDETTEAALNLSAVTGQSVTSAMTQLGKALDNPITGMSAMSRSGVTFSQSQKDMAKELYNSGDALGAQSIILDEIAMQYGGTAKAAAMGLSGAEDTLGQAFQTLSLNMSDSISLSKSLSGAYNSTSDSVFYMSEHTDELLFATEAMAGVFSLAMIPSIVKAGIATGVYVGQVGIATAATNGLTVATRLLMGPWGLLATAITVGAGAFLYAESEADKLNGTLYEQGDSVDELTGKYKELSNAQIGSAYISAQETIIKLEQRRVDLQNKLSTLSGDDSDFNVRYFTDQLSALDNQIVSANSSLTSIQNVFNEGLDAIKWTDTTNDVEEHNGKVEVLSKTYTSWKDKVEGFQTPLQQLMSELSRVNDGLNSGKLNETSGLLGYVDSVKDKISELTEDTSLQDYIDEITASTNTGKIDALNQEIGVLRDLLSFDGIDFDIGTEAIENAKKEIKSLQDTASDDSAIMSTSDAINSGLSSLQSMASDGSSAYSALSTAASAFNTIQAVGAVLTQGTGDPYTAFAKMAAMASAVSSLGQSVSFSGGSFDDESADTQASQGTDIYGNDFSSISDSVDITADATEDLVGINTDMLDALTSLESSMTDAAAISADSVTSSSVSTSSLLSSSGIDSSISYAITDAMEIGTLGVLDTLTLGIFDSAIGSISSSIFGGSSSTVDSGIIVDGGTLGDLMSESFVESYNKVKTDGGWFHSDSYSTYTSDLSDASDQFSLVFESIGDSVYSAGEMLGFSSDYLTDAISSYVVDSLTISLKDLDDDEASEEIEAIFSDVFNDLAESVIPYVSDYQDAGEELGTTLTRLATETSLLNYSADTLGFSLGSLTDNSESLVAAADAMSEYFGGTDSFSDYISTFISEFASDATMLSLYGDTLTESLNDVGLSLPSTSDALWDLMASLDASTTEGEAQIETLLELSSTASEYYDILDDTQDEMADLSDTFASAVLDIYDLSDSVTQVSLDSALAAAKLGDFSLAEMLDTDDYVLDEDDFSSATDYNVAQAVAANKMLEISELSALESGDVETQQLDELRAINASIIASSELLTTQTRILTDSVDYLDRINNNTGE